MMEGVMWMINALVWACLLGGVSGVDVADVGTEVGMEVRDGEESFAFEGKPER